jgi:hypothetical protein
MAFSISQYPIGGTLDSGLVLRAAGSAAITTAVTTDSARLHLGNGATDFTVVIDVTAMTVATGTFKFTVAGSDASSGGDLYVVNMLEIGATGTISGICGLTPPGNRTTGRYMLKCTNIITATGGDTRACPYVFLRLITGATMGSITYSAFISVDAS